MPKVQFSDVVPPDKRSIRNIPIPVGGKRRSVATKLKEEEVMPEKIEKKAVSDGANKIAEEFPVIDATKGQRDFNIKDIKNSPAYEYYYPNDKESQPLPKTNMAVKPKRKRMFYFGAVIVLAGAFLVAMMTVFASASVVVTPKSKDIPVAMKISASADKAEGTVRYEIVKLSKSQAVSVPATGEEEVELKAHGKIVVYNNFSSAPQRLISRTRFESPEGLIYRIPESVVVPGKSGSNPGSIEVEVFADETGDKYNIKKTDFTVPGFKDDKARYAGFYARSSTDMEGGFVGKRKTVSDDQKSTALKNARDVAKAGLEKDLKAKAPDGMTLLSSSTMYEYREMPQEDQTSSVVLGEEVTAYAIMLNRGDLSDAIKSEYAAGYPDWQNIPASIQDFSGLDVVKKPDSIVAGSTMDLEISGSAKLVADIDTEQVKSALAGAGKSQIMPLINQYPAISNVKVAIMPVWKQSFPKDPSKIAVKVEPPQ